MSNQLRFLAYWGFLLAACDSDPVNPVQLGSSSITMGGTSSAIGGASTSGSGTATGGSMIVPTLGGNSSGGATKGGTSAVGAATNGGSGTTTSGTGIGGFTGSCLIIPTPDTGWVAGTSNPCGIQGAWYTYNDCDTSPGDCTLDQRPQPRTPIQNENAKMCTSGTTVPINGDFKKWGAGIALNLNQPPVPANENDKNPISQLLHPLKGFSFRLSGDGIPNPIRVNFPTAATADTAHFKPIVDGIAGTYQVLFSEAVQGSWVEASDRIELVHGDILEVQFQVPGEKSTNVSFNFCIEELTALY